MDAEVAIPIVGLIVSACVAVGVPYLTFSHSRKLERVRLLGVERFRLYVDALTEAHAEMTWLEDRVYTTVYANEEMLPAPPDTRLPPKERARLGARMAAIAESPILLAWNRFDSLAMQYLLSTRTEADLPRFRMEMNTAADALQTAVRDAMAEK